MNDLERERSKLTSLSTEDLRKISAVSKVPLVEEILLDREKASFFELVHVPEDEDARD